MPFQVVKNMVFCTRVIYHHQLDDKASLDASNDLVKKQIMKMEKLARLEAGNCPKDSSKVVHTGLFLLYLILLIQLSQYLSFLLISLFL